MNDNQQKAFDILIKTDGYKLVHQDQYPKGTELIFSNLFLRSSTHPYIKDDIYVFGLKYIIDRITKEWDNFFKLNEDEVVGVLKEFETFTRNYHNLPDYSVERFKELWKHGELPLNIRAIEDNLIVPIKTPIITIYNTDPKFYWMTNYIESYLLTTTWPLITSATTSYHIKNIFIKYLEETSDNVSFADYQGTDFSFRGMSGSESGLLSGIGHLANFEGSSTLQASYEFAKYWGRSSTSVPATEHSVMSSYGKEGEKEAFETMMDKYPKGLLSIVSDTWNIWNVLDNILPELKDKIEARDGKLVIRPDSGSPRLIMCGNPESDNEAERMGVLRLLEKHFGTSVNSKGFKVLNPKVGVIYGDSIRFDTIIDMLEGIKELGFSTENTVFGLGATFYQNNNRDTFGHVFKSTLAIVNGEERELFKNPITNSIKKSYKGLVGVFNIDNKIVTKDQLSWDEYKSDDNLLKLVNK